MNSSANSNLFFWFFPAQSGNKSAPIVLWLQVQLISSLLNRRSSLRNPQAIVIHSLVQGGPGASSMFGVLKEHGPFLADLDVDGKPFVKENPYTWAGNHSVLYVDNPIGTGFSFTDDPDDFPSFVEETTEVIISYFDQNRGRTKDLYGLLIIPKWIGIEEKIRTFSPGPVRSSTAVLHSVSWSC